MIINYSLNDGCAIRSCISQISLLDMSLIFYKRNHHYFSLKVAHSNLFDTIGVWGRHMFFVVVFLLFFM